MPQFAITGLTEATLRALTLAWHRLDAWPDAPAGLARLKHQFLIAPVSNGNISLMVDLARRNHIAWDAILGAEIAGDYKPKPSVYLASAAAFDLEPGACMMVAVMAARHSAVSFICASVSMAPRRMQFTRMPMRP